MNGWTSMLVLVVVAAHVIAVTSALECYNCHTNRDGACGDDFDEDKSGTCDSGGMCKKVANKDNGKYDKR